MPELPIIDLEKEGLENLNALFDKYGFVRIDNAYKESEIAEMQNTMNSIVHDMNPEEVRIIKGGLLFLAFQGYFYIRRRWTEKRMG